MLELATASFLRSFALAFAGLGLQKAGSRGELLGLEADPEAGSDSSAAKVEWKQVQIRS